MIRSLSSSFFAFLLACSLAVPAQAQPGQDGGAVRKVVEQFLQTQSAGLPGKVTITVGQVDPRMALAACPDPQAFQQPGARAWGKITVGVRCTAPSWTVYIQAQVNVIAEYVAAAAPLAQGQPIDASQLAMVKGDLAALPNGIVTDMAQAIGRTPTISLPAGTPLRLDNLKSKPVVMANQTVRVISNGAGFSVSAEGRALTNAAEGQVVQVRTPSGAMLSGTAKAGGIVEVAN
ncbi:MAG TPA: flagellar basal body P-ring formation chaperone FlgA [Telluria sp.]|jgi:flagella basal body P-ring formation protein FlgA